MVEQAIVVRMARPLGAETRLLASLERVLSEVRREELRIALDQNAATVSGSGLESFFGAVLSDETAASQLGCWSPGLGVPRRLMMELNGSPAAGLCIALALELTALQRLGSWSAQLSQPRDLRCGGLLLQSVDRITVGTAGHVQVTGPKGSGTVETLKRRPDNQLFSCDSSDMIAELPVARGIRLLPCSLSWTIDLGRYDNRVKDPTITFAKTIAEALELLDEVAPEYVSWILEAVQEIAPIDIREREGASGSSAYSPGAIGMACTDRVEVVAEMLIHEGSHQYLYALDSIFALETGEAKELFFSPMTGTERPVFGILSAYHAFSNVAIFYEKCADSSVREASSYARNQLNRLLPRLNHLRCSLEGSRELTGVGRLLFEALGDPSE